MRNALETWSDYIASQVLADKFEIVPADTIALPGTEHLDLDDATVDALVELS